MQYKVVKKFYYFEMQGNVEIAIRINLLLFSAITTAEGMKKFFQELKKL